MPEPPGERFDVCVVGSANLDLVATMARLPSPGETVLGDSYAEHPGGKGLNQAVAAARSGARAAFIGAVGDDAAGVMLLGLMSTEGVDATGVRRLADVATGRAMIGVCADGENSIIVVPGANGLVEIDELPESIVVLAQLEVPLAAVRAAFGMARARGATTVLNPAPAQPLDDALLSLCDIVVPNEHEIGLLGGVERVLSLGTRAVVVTHGKRGAMLHTAAGEVHIAAFTVHSVDTTAAGDTFCGALCARLAAGESIESALRYASAAAAISTTGRGAVPSIPSRRNIEAFVEESKPA